jgi:hypothetical protein
MKDYVEFIKWYASGFNLKDEMTRWFLWLLLVIVGSAVFGHSEYWFFGMLLLILLDLCVGMIHWKYREFKREKQDNNLMDLDG